MRKQFLSFEVFLWVTGLHSSGKLMGNEEILIKKVLFTVSPHLLSCPHSVNFQSRNKDVLTALSFFVYCLSLPLKKQETVGIVEFICALGGLYIYRAWLSGGCEVLLCHFSGFLPWSYKFSCVTNIYATSTFLYFLGGRGVTYPNIWMQTLCSSVCGLCQFNNIQN